MSRGIPTSVTSIHELDRIFRTRQAKGQKTSIPLANVEKRVIDGIIAQRTPKHANYMVTETNIVKRPRSEKTLK